MVGARVGGLYIHFRTEDYDDLLQYFKLHNEARKCYIQIATVEHDYKQIINDHITTMVVQMDCRDYDYVNRYLSLLNKSTVDGFVFC